MASSAQQVGFTIAGMLKSDASINAAGTIEFYTSGGAFAVTKIAWSDSGKATELDTSGGIHFATLDAAGKATVYCDGIYDIKVKDSDGNTVDTLLNMYFQFDDTTGLFVVEVITAASATLATSTGFVVLNRNGNVAITLNAVEHGKLITFKNMHASSGVTTINRAGADTFDNAATTATLTGTNATLSIYGDTTNTRWHIVDGTTIYVDTITEQAVGGGVAIDGFGIKDNAPNPTSWPSFHANLGGSDQTNITGLDQVEFDTEIFDTNSDFDITTFRFTPTVAGKYLLYVQVHWSSVTTNDDLNLQLQKNGAAIADDITADAPGAVYKQSVLIIVDANGTTDYFEVYAQNTDRNTSSISGSASTSFFSGSRIA